jgi:hypothetical protein
MPRRADGATSILAAVAALVVAGLIATGCTTGPRRPAATAPRDDQTVTSTIRVSGMLDGGGRRYVGGGALGDGGQGEGQGPLFELADGATLANVVIGSPAADGVHCRGSCTLHDVVWEDVGEDAATFIGTSASQTMVIDGGQARHAADKVFQHNGPGTMVIRNFAVEDFGKLYRSCGNCSSQHPRHVRIDNVTVTAPGKTLAGINENYGDTAELAGIVIHGDDDRRIAICERYRGVTGGEPTRLGRGPAGGCRYAPDDITYR